jgi:hypothetical protein
MLDPFAGGSHQSMGNDIKVAKSGNPACVMVVLSEGRTRDRRKKKETRKPKQKIRKM